jgi:mannose-6-phosphate isomerase-like protein (cupin superfamily)
VCQGACLYVFARNQVFGNLFNHDDAKMMQNHTQITLTVPDLDEALDFFTRRLSFRLEMILPADSPHTALLSGQDITLRLESRAALPTHRQIEAGQLIISRVNETDAWHVGRAEMQYRDLIPGRMGGRFIASHIRIPVGGPVPDYVHYHHVRFQMIYCVTGWARLVYEDQGEPFIFAAGDCVLQPPTIRHRVLEASDGLEVIELGAPAIHETWADHELSLPTKQILPTRSFHHQRFVRHQARSADWQPWRAGFTTRDTGIADATNGLAAVCVVKAETNATTQLTHTSEFLFIFVLNGQLELRPANEKLQAHESCVIPANQDCTLFAEAGAEFLWVTLSNNA